MTSWGFQLMSRTWGTGLGPEGQQRLKPHSCSNMVGKGGSAWIVTSGVRVMGTQVHERLWLQLGCPVEISRFTDEEMEPPVSSSF